MVALRFALVGQELWARFSAATVEVFHRSQRVGSHLRSYQRGVDHDAAGPYADIAPGTCGMDADQPHQLGRLDRRQYLRRGRACAMHERDQETTGCPAASRMSRVISSGWEISERWLDFTSMVLAPMRLAMRRSRSGLIVRSSVETA